MNASEMQGLKFVLNFNSKMPYQHPHGNFACDCEVNIQLRLTEMPHLLPTKMQLLHLR